MDAMFTRIVTAELLRIGDSHHRLYRDSPEFHAAINAIVTTLPDVVAAAAKRATEAAEQQRKLYASLQTRPGPGFRPGPEWIPPQA